MKPEGPESGRGNHLTDGKRLQRRSGCVVVSVGVEGLPPPLWAAAQGTDPWSERALGCPESADSGGGILYLPQPSEKIAPHPIQPATTDPTEGGDLRPRRYSTHGSAAGGKFFRYFGFFVLAEIAADRNRFGFWNQFVGQKKMRSKFKSKMQGKIKNQYLVRGKPNSFIQLCLFRF